MLKKSRLSTLISLSIAASVGLTACSSDDAPRSSGPSSVTGVSVSGTAAKGIIKDGVVIAEELGADKIAIAQVGDARTGLDGSYTMSLSDDYTGGPVQITVTMDADSEMKCDVPVGCGTRTDDVTDTDTAINFGEWYKPASLTITALVPDSAANADVSVNVTPFTHMAAERAKVAATLDASAIANANSEVSVLLGGLDILNTAPIDITDPAAVADASPTETTYAALASSLGNQGDVDANGQPDLDGAIALLAASFAEGTLLADDSAGLDDEQISLQEIVDAANDTFTAAGVSDTTGVVAALEDDIAVASAGDGTINPDPVDTAASDEIEQARAMIADLRTWGSVIDAEIGTKGSEFDEQIDMANSVLDAFSDIQTPGDALSAAMEAALLFFDGTNSSSDLTTYVIDEFASLPQDAAPFTGGTIAQTSMGVITITNGVVYGYTVNLTVNIPDDQMMATLFNIGIASASVTSDDVSLNVNSGNVAVTLAEAYTLDYEALDLGTELPLPQVTDLTFDLDVSITQNTGVDELGMPVALASPVTFAGGLSFDADPATVSGSELVNEAALPQSFELSGTVSNASNSYDMSLVTNVTNTASFVVDADGSIGDTETNFIDADIGITFTAQLTGLPEALINITADRTGFEMANLATTISYGDRSLVISADVTEDNLTGVAGIDGSLTISNQDNIVLTIVDSDVDDTTPFSGTISFNGTEIGSVEEFENFIKFTYDDGTFELF